MTTKAKRDLAFLFTEEEKRAIEERSREQGISITKFLRMKIDEIVDRPRPFYVSVPTPTRRRFLDYVSRRGSTLEKVLVDEILRPAPCGDNQTEPDAASATFSDDDEAPRSPLVQRMSAELETAQYLLDAARADHQRVSAELDRYRAAINRIGSAFGHQAYIGPDGTEQTTPVPERVPDLVVGMISELVDLRVVKK